MRRLVLVVALLLAGCQQMPALQDATTSAVSPAVQLRAEGDAFMASGNYAGAVEKFRQAVDLDPASVTLRFALGSAYSFLDRRLEAISQFRWVMANSVVGTTEHDESRRWLIRVGALADVVAPGAKAQSSPGENANKDPSAQGSIGGQTQWSGVTPAEHRISLRVSMLGTEDRTRGVQARTELLLGEAFEFKDIPEGQYRVVGIADERMVWDQNVTVMGGKRTDLAWSQAESSLPKTAFPPARK
jgi:tetratricopeptide repeat protein